MARYYIVYTYKAYPDSDTDTYEDVIDVHPIAWLSESRRVHREAIEHTLKTYGPGGVADRIDQYRIIYSIPIPDDLAFEPEE